MRAGIYELESEIGRGGLGVVYRGRGPDGTLVAIKFLQKRDPATLARFAREARLQELLSVEQGFVPVLSSGVERDAPYLVLPFLPGGTLRDRLAAGPLPVGASVSIVRTLAEALGRAHERGVVHRDLKPENVLFTADGRPLVADLGLAKHYRHDVAGASASVVMSRRGNFAGTFGYMAPEQMSDASSVGPTADVFALGAILYECLAGAPAFDGSSTLELLARVDECAPTPLHERRVGVPESLERVVARTLARDPNARFGNARDLADALRGVPDMPSPPKGADSRLYEGGDSAEASARPPEPSGKGPRGAVALGIAGALVVVAGLLSGLGVWLAKRGRVERNVRSGDDAFEKKDWDKALAAYKLVLDDDRENPRATERRVRCEAELDELAIETEARARLVKARTLAPEAALRILTEDSIDKKLDHLQNAKVVARADVLVAIAHAHLRLSGDLARREAPAREVAGEIDEARKALDSAAATSAVPLIAVSLERIRMIDRQRGRGPEISTILSQLSARDADGWAGAYARGRLALEAKSPRLDVALIQLNDAVVRTQDQNLLPEAVYFRGRALLAAARVADAKADFNLALAGLTDDPRPAIELAKISLDRDNDPARSSALVQEAIGRGVPDDPEILALQGELAVLQGQFAAALPKLDQALRADGSLVRARRARARAWVEVNKDKPPTPELEADLEAAIPRFPDDVKLHALRAIIRTSRSDYAGAIVDLDAYLRVTDDDDVRLRRARAYGKLHKFDEAIADCDWLISRNKNNASARAERAVNLLGKSDYARALEDLTTVLGMASGTSAAQVRYMRGIANLGTKHYRDGIDDFEAYLRDMPDGADADRARKWIEQCQLALARQKRGS